MPTIELILTTAQIRQLQAGKSIRLPKKLPTMTSVMVSDEMMAKIEKAQSKQTGCMISGIIETEGEGFDSENEEAMGGSLRSLRRKFNKASKQVNRVVNHIENADKYVQPKYLKQLPKYIKKGSHELGAAVQVAKKYVPQEVTNAIVSNAAGAAAGVASFGNPAAIAAARATASSAVNATYETNLKHGSVGKNFGKNFGKSLAKEAMLAGVGSMVPTGVSQPSGAGFSYMADVGGRGFKPTQGGQISGGQISGGKLPKGSDAAKARMAELRSRRKGTINGKGYLSL